MVQMNDKDLWKAIRRETPDDLEKYATMFPHFCLKIFWDLSDDDIEDALTGLATNDDSIDAFYVDEEQREVNIIQFKAHESSAKSGQNIEKSCFTYLASAPGKLRDDSYIQQHKNERIRQIAKEYGEYIRQDFKHKLHFFHLGCSGRQKEVVEHHRKKDGMEYYDLDKIKSEYGEYLSRLSRTEPEKITLDLELGVIAPKFGNNNKHKTIISVITGDAIIALMEEHRYNLFDKNLRSGLGPNAINKKIMKTANNEKNLFYFYNNGITITAKKIKYISASKYTLEYPQIINGAQTVTAIYDAWKEEGRPEKSTFKDIKVLFKVIEDQNRNDENMTAFAKDVICYNNTQNAVKRPDFYANNSEQIKLQELMYELGYFYERKRGDRRFLEGLKTTSNLQRRTKKDFLHWKEKITIEGIAKIWMAYAFSPNAQSVEAIKIFGADSKAQAAYEKIFDSETLDLEKAKEMVLAYNIFDILEKQFKIYGNAEKTGQIIQKVDDAISGKNDQLKKAQELVKNSLIFGEQLKQDFCNFDKCKSDIKKQIEAYQFLIKGKYLVLAIFGLIIKECEYTDPLIKNNLYKKKEFLESNIVKKWLPTILRKIVKEEYKAFKASDPNATRMVDAFYAPQERWEKIKVRFSDYRHDEDRSFKELFPLMFR